MNLRLSIFLLLFSFVAHGQIYRGLKAVEPYEDQLDSLDAYLKSNPKKYRKLYAEMEVVQQQNGDKTLLAILNIFQGSFHYYSNRMDVAGNFFDQAMAISSEIGNDRIYRTAKIRKIFTDEFKKTKYQMAKEMEEIYVDSYNKKDTINMLYSLNGLGIFYGDIDSVSLSLKIFYEALRLSDLSENLYEKGFILNNLGLIKYDLGAIDSAFSDFKQCLEIGMATDNISLEGIARQNMGLYYSRVDSNERAREEYLKVHKIGKESGYTLYEISSITNLANLEMREGNAKASDSLGLLALDIAVSGGMFDVVSNIYLGRTYYHLRNEDYSSALSALDSALAYSDYAAYHEVMPPYFHLRYRVYEEMGDYEKAFEYYKEKVAVQDSLDEIGDAKLLSELQFRYEDEKKERLRSVKENKLKLQIKQGEVDMARYRQNVVILITIFLVILFTIVILYFRLKQRSDNLFSYTIANKLEEERSRIARDLHDGLGQSMIVLKNKFSQVKGADDQKMEEINDNFSSVIEEIRSISRSLIPPELRRLGLQKAVESMGQEIERSTGIMVTAEVDAFGELEFKEHQSLRLYRVLQELCTNTVKHSGANSIKIDSIIQGKDLVVVYQDNGAGLDLELWKSAENSVGFKSIHQRIKYLKGSIKVEKPKVGFKVEIKIPID